MADRRFTCDEVPGEVFEAADVDQAARAVCDVLGTFPVGVGSQYQDGRIEGDYTEAPDVEATWFVDPPYDNRAGRRYRCQPGSFEALGAWCRERRGQVIATDTTEATWLPFRPLGIGAGFGQKNRASGSTEAVWSSDDP